MTTPFSFEQFIRSSGSIRFSMEVVENQENYIEMLVRSENDPTDTFSIYIERDVVFGKTALDGFKKHFGKHLKKKDQKFTVDNLYKKMIGR